MPISTAKLVLAWKEVLTLSKVRPEENVLILTSKNSNSELVDTAILAAHLLGANTVRLDVEPSWDTHEVGSDPTVVSGKSSIDNNSMALAAMKAADLVIDLVFMLFTPGQREVLDSGTRILLAYDSPETLVRLLPTEDDRARVLAAKNAYLQARTMRVTSAAGTHLVARIGQYGITAEYGFVDEAGRWDHWPSGFVARLPDDESAHGTVVLAPGDIILPFKIYVQSTIRLTIESGLVTCIEGGLDAEFLKSYLDGFKDPHAYGVSHLGWGLQPRARWTSLGLHDKHPTIGMEARSFYGNFLFSTGPAGARTTPAHLDIPMRGCSLYLDDEPMIIDGDVIPEAQRVDGAGRQ